MMTFIGGDITGITISAIGLIVFILKTEQINWGVRLG